MVAKGDKVAYRSMGGDLWDAEITRVRDKDFVDIAITGPTLKAPMEFHAVRWREEPDSPLSGARPRRP